MKTLQLLLLAAATAAFCAPSFAQTDASDRAGTTSQQPIFIIKFSEPGLLYNDGQRSGFAATAPSSTGSRKLNASTPAAAAWRGFLADQQDQYLSQMESRLARPLAPVHRYDVTMNGVAVRMTEAEAAQVRGLPGVVSVEQEQIYQLETDAGPGFIQAPAIWTGTGTPINVGTRGENVLVGVFDSGANQDHPSFANDASCGFTAQNRKLVAAKDCNTANCAGGNGEDVSIFVDTTNTGSSGHGVHTASTAVGNVVTAGTMVNGVPARFNISGVAPCAKLISYKVCGTTEPSGVAGCSGAAIAAAIQTAIVDQVDVMNFSISGGGNPWNDNDRGFLDMVNADIFVAASAGNTRTATPDPVGNVAHRGPWVLTVANSSHDRVVTNPVSVAGSLQNVPSQESNGTPFAATVTLPVASGAALGNEFGCTDLGGYAAGSMTGRIALIKRGPVAPGVACAFSEKINNAAAAGAVGVVVYDRSPGPPLSMDVTGTTIPAVFIREAAGNTLRDFLATNPTAQMTIVAPSQRIIDSGVADVLNASSLRGPNVTFDVTKPDITGPGTNIYAAVSDNFGQFGFLSGTSMSSPHLAGAAALVRAVHPSWTVQEVKSALMLTASVPGRRQDEITPWDADDVGSGRVDLSKATRSGLVMNETFANFLAADPANGNPNLARQLNLPSMRHVTIAGSYVFNRTFRNAYGKAVNWASSVTNPPGMTVTVSPANFSFGNNPQQTQTVQITVTVNSAQTPLAFGAVTFTPTVVVDPAILFADGLEAPLQAPLPARLTITAKGTP